MHSPINRPKRTQQKLPSLAPTYTRIQTCGPIRAGSSANKTNVSTNRSFLKKPGSPNIPIQAIGLSLYEALGTDPVEAPGTKVTRTQWLDLSSLEMANLIGKNILIVDEVDDTRTTLEYAVRELEKDVIEAQKKSGREGEKTTFSIFVLHNKDKQKKGKLPEDIVQGRYEAARTVGDEWICYPWEATDIEEHDRLSREAEQKQ